MWSIDPDRRFFVFIGTQNVGVRVYGITPLITPTKLKLSIVIKINDIIFSGSQAAGNAICYQSEHLTSSKFL
jgi:hypothetical protein